MIDPPPLSRALDEAMSAVAAAIEVYHRNAAESGTLSLEIREALSRAMKRVSDASRLDREQQMQQRLQPSPPSAPSADGSLPVGWLPAVSSVRDQSAA